jgi:voltage-gated potassium channel
MRRGEKSQSKQDGKLNGAMSWRQCLRGLYEADTTRGHRFRYGLLVFDLITIAFIIVTSFLPYLPAIEELDVLFGIAILADFAARLAISRAPWRDFLHPATWADVAAIISFLAPVIGEGFAFLRVMRTLRLLRTYHLLAQLRADSPFFRRHEDLIFAATNLAVFVFVTTGAVYETQHYNNSSIHNYADPRRTPCPWPPRAAPPARRSA